MLLDSTCSLKKKKQQYCVYIFECDIFMQEITFEFSRNQSLYFIHTSLPCIQRARPQHAVQPFEVSNGLFTLPNDNQTH